MNTTSLHIEPNYVEKLQSLAQEKGETASQLLSKIIDEYIARSESHIENVNLMKLSEDSFKEWHNEDDAIYDTM